MGDPVPSHRLETDRIGQRQALVGEAGEPSGHRMRDEIRRDPMPLMRRIGEKLSDGFARRARPTQIQDPAVKFDEDGKRAHIPSTGFAVGVRRLDRANMILIAGVG